MTIQQLIEHPKGTLSFLKQHLCLYSPKEGAKIQNGVCIVNSSIEKVNCEFVGSLYRYYYKNRKPVEEIIEYGAVIFTSKVKVKLSAFSNSTIKTVYFLDNAIDSDIEYDANTQHIPLILISRSNKSKVQRFCEQYNIKYNKVGNSYAKNSN